MTALPEHTSAAQMALYASCPRKYQYRYVDRAEPEFKSVSLALGSAVHSAIGWYFQQRTMGHVPAMEEVRTVVRADLTAATDTTTRFGKWTAEDLEDHAQRLVACFIEAHPALPVKQNEARFELNLHDPDTGEVLPRKLLGYLDFITSDGRVVELKTARSDYTALDLASNIQFGAYRLALEQLAIGKELVVVAIIKNKRPRLQTIRLTPEPRTSSFFLKAAAEIERGILAGQFHPAPGPHCGGCEFQVRCLGTTAAPHDKAA